MSQEQFILIGRWVAAGVPLLLGLWILLFNVLRYLPSIHRGSTRPSSVPMAGSLFFLTGLYLAPIEFRFGYLLVLLLEFFSVDVSMDTEPEDAGDEDANEHEGKD